MTAALDLLEQILQDSLELDRAWEARATPLYFQLRRRHTWWMYKLFRTRAWNDADVAELMNETFSRYLESLRRTFWNTNGVHGQSEPIFQDGKVIALRLLPAKPITDLESYTFRSPGGWLRTVATNVLNRYANKAATGSEGAKEFKRAAKFPTRRNGKPQYFHSSPLLEDLYAPPRNMEDYLIAESRAREIRERYIAALTNLPPVQRAAWVLCKDELLPWNQAERMLAPILHWRTARAALKRKPLQDAEVSLLLGRADVSPDASKAANKLGEQLFDLDPFRARRLPVAKWSREYLGRLTSHCGSFKSLCVRLEQRAPPEDVPGAISERDKDFIRGMPGLQRQHQHIRPLEQESVSAYSMNLRPGWVKAPEPDAPEYVESLQKIRELLEARKRYATIANVLNATHVPPRFGNTWHHTAVRLIARRARLIKIVPVIRAAPLTDSAETLTKRTSRRPSGKRAADAFHRSDDALLTARGHRQVGKKVSGKRKQGSKPVQKARRNTRQWNELPKNTLKKARTRRKPSKTVSSKAASLPKTLRRGNATKKARLKRYVGKRGKKRPRARYC